MTTMRATQLALIGAAAILMGCAEAPVESPGSGSEVANWQRTQTEWDQWPWHSSSFDGVVALGGAVQPDSVMGQFSVSLLASTTQTTTVSFAHGACAFGVRLYRDEALQSEPAWDNRPPQGSGCILPLYYQYIGATTPLNKRIGTIKPTALSDSLPNGKYWVAVVLKLNQTVRVVPAGAVFVARP